MEKTALIPESKGALLQNIDGSSMYLNSYKWFMPMQMRSGQDPLKLAGYKVACRFSAADLVSPPQLSLSLSLSTSCFLPLLLFLLVKVSAAPVTLGEKREA